MKWWITVLFALVVLPSSFGQGARYLIRNYDLLNEVNLNGSTWSMIQDSSGILYFGADYGLVTYNGSDWGLFSRDQSIIRSLFYDSRSRIIYGGYNDFGIIERNQTTGLSFRSLAATLPDSLEGFGDIWSIVETGGQVFLHSNNRIFILDRDKVSVIPAHETYHRSFIMNDRFAVNMKSAGLHHYDGGTFVALEGGSFFADKVVSCVFGAESENYFIGTRNSGVWLYNPVTGGIGDPFTGHPETQKLLTRYGIYHGLVLPDKNLAFATLFGGTILTSPSGRILKVLNRNHGLRDNVNYFIGTSRDCNLWICSSNGISAYNLNSPFILWDYTSGIDGVVLDIEEYQGSVYIATLTGLYEIPGFSPDRQPFQMPARRLLSSEVWSLTRIDGAAGEDLYLGTGTGLAKLKGDELAWVSKGGSVLKVIQPRCDPDLLLALRADDFDIFRRTSGKYSHFATVHNLYQGLRTVAEDERGHLWIGTRNSGVVEVSLLELLASDIQKQSPADFSKLPVKRKVHTFGVLLTDVIGYENSVIFTNSGGLFRFDPVRQEFSKCLLFGPEIARYPHMISALRKDGRGNIWVGGEDIFMVRPDGTYTPDKLNFQQLKDVFSAFVFLHTSDRKTWIGGNSGVYLYDSQVNMNLPERLQTLITRIEIHPRPPIHVNAGRLTSELPDNDVLRHDELLEIDLNRRNSQATFHYSLPYYESEERTVYSYQLEGYTSEWSSWSSNPQVTFSNLKPSSYTFRVRGRSSFGQVGEEAEIHFTVPARWYLTTFAILLYLVLMVVVVILTAGHISRIRIRKHLRIEDIIRKRIQESNRAHIMTLYPAGSGMDSQGAGTDDSGKPRIGEGPSGAMAQSQQFLSKALKILENNMSSHDLTAGRFCHELGMSQPRVYRKLIALTGMSINQFIRNIRLKKAAQMLIETDLSISEVAYKTGFTSPGYFTRCFKSEFGMSPRDFSQRRHDSR